MIRILTFTTLYPNPVVPHHGVFVENRLRHLVASAMVRTRVVAPVPWCPLIGPAFAEYAQWVGVPPTDSRHGIPVLHPRFLRLPKIGMSTAPFFMYRALRPVVAKLLAEEDVDLIDAHYFYPDGVAAVLLGRAFNKPVAITARGTDLNLIPRYAVPRRMIQWAATQAAGLVTVCQALKDTLIDLGIADERVTVLRNGVDLEMFRRGDRPAARARLGLDRPTLLSVGHLIERKAHDLVIKALPMLPDCDLLIAGSGPEDANLRRLAQALGVEDRVRFLGRIGHQALRQVYEAADVLVLASSREGWANVLLEAMACGTPVVASNVWGTPEVVAAPEAGLLMETRTPDALADAVGRLLAAPPDRVATRAYAEGFSWDATTKGQIDLFARILAERGGS